MKFFIEVHSVRVSHYYIFVTVFKIKSENSVTCAGDSLIISIYLQLFNLFRGQSVNQLKLDMTVVPLKEKRVVLELKQFRWFQDGLLSR